jgi:hypothetical protein
LKSSVITDGNYIYIASPSWQVGRIFFILFIFHFNFYFSRTKLIENEQGSGRDRENQASQFMFIEF